MRILLSFAVCLAAGFLRAGEPREVSEPKDWFETDFPQSWRHADGDAVYRW